MSIGIKAVLQKFNLKSLGFWAPRSLNSPIEGDMGVRINEMREYNVVIEKDEDGVYVASVPSLRGCHTQAKSLDTLMKRIQEAILLCREVEDESRNEFVGVQRIAVGV